MLAQIIVGLIIISVVSAAAFSLYGSLHSSAASNNAQQYLVNLRGSVEQMFSGNPNFTGFTTKTAKKAGIFSGNVGNTLTNGKVTAPGGYKIKLGNVSGKTNQWSMTASSVQQGLCGTIAGAFTGSSVVSISVNGTSVSNPAYGSGSSTWPPSTATLISNCKGSSNTISWKFAD